MYHELTKEDIRRRSRRRILGALCLIALVAVLWFGFAQIQASLHAQGELSVRNAILDSAKQCAAIEGSYPVSLSYLEDNYGLAINRSDYTITYDVFAGNVLPSVVVLAK